MESLKEQLEYLRKLGASKLEEYMWLFNEEPVLPTMANYNDDIYIKLLDMAIARRKPLTDEEVFAAYKDKLDVVSKNIEHEKAMELYKLGGKK